MGLCKCPKKLVTSLFCFEHRVNVCPHCIVEEHQKCIVQSYLQWLNDSDYNPVCQLCKKLLEYADCVRLVCFDIFHVHCLDNWAKSYPLNTAPAGYRCPICTSAIFPPSNMVSPVADALRGRLSDFSWARSGLDMPLVNNVHCEVESNASSSVENNVTSNKFENLRGDPDGKDISTMSQESFASDWQSNISHYVDKTSSRKHSDYSTTILMNNDENDDKYHRRSPLSALNRWLRTFYKPSARHHQGFISRRRMFLVLMVFAVVTMLVLLAYYGRSGGYDPMLDPQNNPNIHVED